jgi:non-heme chloroperoxidase
MNEILEIILTQILISFLIFLCIALVLILIDGKPKANIAEQNDLSFDGLAIDYNEIPPLDTYSPRDGVNLKYRNYPSQSDKVLVLMHGSGWHSQYFMPLAKYLSSEKVAHVYTPDLRGHGTNPIKRGDIDYINQLEDDMADFLSFVKNKHPNSKIIIGGHSSGGGLVIRFAGSQYGKVADGYMLLSPYLKYNAPTIRKNSGGWASPHMPRIVGLSMLNGSKITLLNHLHCIDFHMPENVRDGAETLSYSYRLNTGYAPRNYKKDLSAAKQPMIVVAGTADESFVADQFLPEMSKYKKDIEVTLVEGLSHMGVVIGEEVRPILKDWFNTLN